MATVHLQETWARRLGRFLWRHKVLTVFGVIIIASAVVFVVQTSTWNTQVASERERYLQTKKTLYAWAPELSEVVGAQAHMKSDCTYTSDGTVFGYRHLGCGTEIAFSKPISDEVTAASLGQAAYKILERYGVSGIENPGGKDKYDIDIYTFDLNQIGCAYVSSYFDATAMPSSRSEGAIRTGNVFYASIGCAGDALEPYFPATN